jgi:hypothetical protein
MPVGGRGMQRALVGLRALEPAVGTGLVQLPGISLRGLDPEKSTGPTVAPVGGPL